LIWYLSPLLILPPTIIFLQLHPFQPQLPFQVIRHELTLILQDHKAVCKSAKSWGTKSKSVRAYQILNIYGDLPNLGDLIFIETYF